MIGRTEQKYQSQAAQSPREHTTDVLNAAACRLPALLELAGKTPGGVATLVLLRPQSLMQRFHLVSHIRFQRVMTPSLLAPSALPAA